MAKQVDTYNILDENGNVEGTVKYEEGSEEFAELRRRRAEGEKIQFYKPDVDKDEYLPVYQAKTSTVINPGMGTVTVTGPSWLTKDVVNSETFKQNITENSALLKLVNLFNSDPTAVIPTSDGDSLTVADALRQFTFQGNSIAEMVPAMVERRNTIADRYGVDLSENQIMESWASYDVNNYNPTSPVYVPEWAGKMYDWTSLPTWDAENHTVSAKDFFDNVYQASLSDMTGSNIQDQAIKQLEGFLKYSSYDENDADEVDAHVSNMRTDQYKEELARTIALANTAAKSKPELSGALNTMVFTVGAGKSFANAAVNAGYSVFGGIMEAFDNIASGAGIPNEANYLNPVYLGAFVCGELIRLGAALDRDGSQSFDTLVGDIVNDLKGISSGETGKNINEARKLLNSTADEFNRYYEQKSDAYAVGEFIGDTAWKIAENIIALNRIGGVIEGFLAPTEAATGIGAFLKAAVSSEHVARLFKVVGLGTNVAAQGVLETWFDDKDLVDKAFASGEMTPELTEKLGYNMLWNLIGEAGGRGTGMLLTRTTPGKAVNMAVRKVTAKAGAWKDSMLYKFFTRLNKLDPENLAAVEEGSAKGLAAFNTAAYKIRADANRLISNLPIFKEMGEEEQQALLQAYEWITRGTSGEITDEAENIARLADELEGGSATTSRSIKERVDSNFENFKKAIAIRTNFENQIDAITRGIAAKQQEITAYAGDRAVAYQESLNDYITAEQKAIRGGAGLTVRDNSFVSKQAAEYLSYTSQLGRAEFKMAEATGKNLDAISNYVDGIEEKLAALRGQLGDELTNKLEALLPKMSAYNAAVNDYMVAKGYASSDYANLMNNLRNNQGWGENGERYIPTMRLFDDGSEGGNLVLAKNLDDQALFKTKAVGDDMFEYKPGNLDASFVDPNLVLFGHLMTAARVSQAADISRAIAAVGTPFRAVRGFSEDGASLYEKNLVETGMRKLRSDFVNLFNSRIGALSETIEKLTLGNIPDIAAKNTLLKSANEDLAKARKQVDAFAWRSLGGDKEARPRFYVKSSSSEEVNTLLSLVPEDIETPDFDISAISFRGTTYKKWFENLDPVDKASILSRLAGRENNLKNFRSVVKESPDLVTDFKKNWICGVSEEAKAFRKSDAFKDFVTEKAAQELSADDKIHREAARKYYNAMKATRGGVQTDFNAKEAATYGREFTVQTDLMARTIASNMSKAIEPNGTVQGMIKQLTGAGMSYDDALSYITLRQLSNLKPAQLIPDSSLFKSKLMSAGGKNMKATTLQNLSNSVRKVVGDAVKDNLDKYLDEIYQANVRTAGDVMDMDYYWNEIDKNIQDVMQHEGKYFAGGDMARYYNRNIVEMVGKDGQIRFYETDPVSAFMSTHKPGYVGKSTQNMITDAIQNVNYAFNQIFRWGTTGFDRVSYVNQWFRDSMNAVLLGAGRPFTDLGTGGTLGRSVLSDSMPLGEKLFGKQITSMVSEEVVESTFKATEDGLRNEFGQELVDRIRETATKGLTGEYAEAAYKRALVEYSVAETGYKTLPGFSTELEFYQASGNGLEQVSGSEAYKEFMNKMYGGGADRGVFSKRMGKARQKFNSAITNVSRGQWRESFLRKSVYTSQYKNAIKSGMTMADAKIWATRYALDATTDFGRTFAFGNRLFNNVPYLGAAINGTKSFYRLISLDPIGMTARFASNIIVPYMLLISETLSDPDNRKIYKTIREYEKEDSLVLVYKGSKISIPLPQEITGFLAPFRHMVEKAADVNDISWLNLITSDALGMMPLDMSGFAELDANDVLAEDDESGLWTHIGRGVEKMASSLMPPVVKAAYMFKSRRDPYTGREINRDYVILDEEGNETVMSNAQSDIAKAIGAAFPELGATGAYEVLKNLFGRSTLRVLDGAVELFNGTAAEDPAAWLEGRIGGAIEQYTSTLTNSATYDEVNSNWKRAIDELYDTRAALINDEAFQKAYSVLQSTTASDEKRQGAMATYREKLDDFAFKVLHTAQNLKQKYPDYYTRERLAQVVSLLTLPTGYTYNETAAAAQLRNDAYYDAKDFAVNTLLRMGFPTDTAGPNMLGYGYYDSNNTYKFKVFTPYEIQALQNDAFGSAEEFQAQITRALKAADISTSDMWNAYYASSNKAERKKNMAAWNASVVPVIAPIIEKYGVDAVLSNSKTRELLDDYIYVSNPFKTKQYLYQIFGGGQ